MSALPSLLLSFLIINALHGFLLWQQRHNRQPTISEYAIKDRKTELLYLAGHLLAGLFFAVFAYRLFYQNYHNTIMFFATFVGVVFEWLQAIFPSRGKYSKVHYCTAFTMLLYLIGMCELATFLLPLTALKTAASATIGILLLLSFVYFSYCIISKRDRTYFWIVQSINILLIYADMAILIR